MAMATTGAARSVETTSRVRSSRAAPSRSGSVRSRVGATASGGSSAV
jgi:hypothetical protein